MAQSGSAEVLGTSGRRFESCYPDHKLLILLLIYIFRSWISGYRSNLLHSQAHFPHRLKFIVCIVPLIEMGADNGLDEGV